MSVTVPEGMAGGMTMTVNVKGQDMQLTIPAGVAPGMSFQFQVPATPPIATPVATPVVATPVTMGQPMQQMPMGQPVQQMQPVPMAPAPQVMVQPAPQVIVQEVPAQPQQVVVMPTVQYREEQYCGIITWAVACCVPCGFWVVFCPLDTRMVPV